MANAICRLSTFIIPIIVESFTTKSEKFEKRKKPASNLCIEERFTPAFTVAVTEPTRDKRNARKNREEGDKER